MPTKSELEARIKELEADHATAEVLLEIGHALNLAKDEQDIIGIVGKPAIDAGVDDVDLMYFETNETGVVCWFTKVAGWRREGTPFTPAGAHYAVSDFPFFETVVAGGGGLVLLDNIATDQRLDETTRDALSQVGTQSCALVPLYHAGKWVGMLLFEWYSPHQFSEREREIYRTLTDLVSPILEIRRMVGNLEQTIKDRTANLNIFRQFAEASGQGFGMCSLGGQIAYANPMFAHILRAARVDDLLGKAMTDFYTGTQRQQLGQVIFPAVLERGGWSGEREATAADGTSVPTLETYFLIRDEDGTPHRIASILIDITEQKQAEAEREHLQEQLIQAQKDALRELSTPIIPIMDGVIIMPIIGNVDTFRARDIMRVLLSGISKHRAKVVILDITGMPMVDTGVANHLHKTIQAARLKGAYTLLTGISDAVAETLVGLGIDWEHMETLRDLQTGLLRAMQRMGVQVL